MFYAIGSIVYCFPGDVNRGIRVDKPSELCGVLAPYVGKQMTESEADAFLCEVILKHPIMEGATDVKISVMRYDGRVTSFYQTLFIKNDEYERQAIRTPSPIRWR